MKFIKTDEITDEIGVFITKKYHDFVSDLSRYDINEVLNATNQETPSNQIWQLFYLNFSRTGSDPNPWVGTWTWSGGSVRYDLNIFSVSPGTLTLGLGEFMVYYFIDTPINETFSDGTSKPFLIERTIGIRKNTEGAYIQAVDILKYCNLEISGTGDINWKLTKRGKVYTFTYTSRLIFNEGRLTFEILKNFSGSFLVSNFDFPVCVGGGSLVHNTATSSYTTRLFIDAGTLKANIQHGTGGSISFIA